MRFFDPPADSIKSFAVGPDLFREYAEWRETVDQICGRDVFTTEEGQILLVGFTKKKPTLRLSLV